MKYYLINEFISMSERELNEFIEDCLSDTHSDTFSIREITQEEYFKQNFTPAFLSAFN